MGEAFAVLNIFATTFSKVLVDEIVFRCGDLKSIHMLLSRPVHDLKIKLS